MKENKFAEDGLDEMEKILKETIVGRLALSDNSIPYIVPLNFSYHNGKIFFHCAWEGKKLEILRDNPNCCFEVDRYAGNAIYHYETECHLEYDSVLAFGKAHIVENEGEMLDLLKMFCDKYSSKDGLALTPERARKCCCVVVDVERLTGRRERGGLKGISKGKYQKTTWLHEFKTKN